MSTADRLWVERRLDEVKSEERAAEMLDNPLERELADPGTSAHQNFPPPLRVGFSYLGDVALTAGQPATLAITATTIAGKPLAPACIVGDPTAGGAQSQDGQLFWTPKASGAFVMQCQAESVVDYRLLYVGP